MELVRFAYDNLRRKPKNAYFFAFSIIAASAVITLFFSILGNPYYGTSSMTNMANTIAFAQFDGGIGNGIFTMILSLLMIFICVITVFFSNKFFLMSKVEDIGVMMISGCNVIRLSIFLIVQNFIILCVAAPIGALIGFACHPIINYLIYQSMGISAPIFAFSTDAMIYCLITLFMVGFWLIIVDSGFIYRMDSLDTLLKSKKSMDPIGKPKNMYFKLFYLFIYAYILYFLCSLDFSKINFIFMVYVSVAIVLGPANIFRYIFPDAIKWLKDKFHYSDPCRVISAGNLRYSIINSNLLVTIILVDVSILFFYLCKFRNDDATFMVVLVSYVVSLLLICICIGYKLSSDALNKKRIFQNMMSIGYLKSDIKRIIHQEISGFFFLIIFICIPLLLVISTMYTMIHVISLNFMISMLLLFIAMISVSGIIMYKVYCYLIFKEALTKPITYEE